MHFQPRDDTDFAEILHDTGLIEKDFEKAKKNQERRNQARAAKTSTVRNSKRNK